MSVKAPVGSTIGLSALIETIVVTMIVAHAGISSFQTLRFMRCVSATAYYCVIAFRILLIV
jgi:hypothetical protein